MWVNTKKAVQQAEAIAAKVVKKQGSGRDKTKEKPVATIRPDPNASPRKSPKKKTTKPQIQVHICNTPGSLGKAGISDSFTLDTTVVSDFDHSQDDFDATTVCSGLTTLASPKRYLS